MLDIRHLPIAARHAHILPALASGSLLSIGQLCDHGFSAYFDRTKLYILYNSRVIMQGTRDNSKLWTIDNPPTTTHSLNTIIDAPIAGRIKFYTASLVYTASLFLQQPFQLDFSPHFQYLPPSNCAKLHYSPLPHQWDTSMQNAAISSLQRQKQ